MHLFQMIQRFFDALFLNNPIVIMTYFRITVCFIFACIYSVTAAEERLDTIRRHLDEVVVTAQNSTRDIIPVQTLSGEELHRLNSWKSHVRLPPCGKV